MGQLIGHIAALARFPVKSMGGEAPDELAIGWHGVVGDRVWSFVKQDGHSRFPWFTGRDLSQLVTYRAAYPPGADPRTTTPIVTAPDGWSGAVDDPALASKLAGEAVSSPRLIQLGRGTYDSMPVSLVSNAGHAEVEAVHGATIDMRRFRINLTVETEMPMRVWTGRKLSIGGEDGPVLVAVMPIKRCVMITIDPDTGERDPWLMRTIAQQFGNFYGIYANVARPGLVRRGDEVRLSD